jgi:hypothetical protein
VTIEVFEAWSEERSRIVNVQLRRSISRRLDEGDRLADEWPQDLVANVYLRDGRRKLHPVDVATDGVHLVLTAEAADVLGPTLLPGCELLPMRGSDGAPYALVNPEPRDALDRQRSEIVRIRDIQATLPGELTERLSRDELDHVVEISAHVFAERALDGASVFRLPFELSARPLFTDRFVVAYQQLGLTGLVFRSLWRADGGVRPTR